MKRFTRSLFAWALAVAGFSLTGGSAQAALADYFGSYAANLASSEESVDVFYGRVEFTATVGGVSGNLQTRAGKNYPFTAKIKESGDTAVVFDAQQVNNIALAKVSGAFTINFALTIKADGTLVITGTNTKVGDANGNFFVSRSYKFVKFTGQPNSQPAWKGNYTLALLAPESAGSDVPAGAGYASLSVTPTGKLNYKGKLGDGTSLTGSANPVAGAVYSLFVRPPGYVPGGYFLAELEVDQRGELAEPALWKKAAKIADKAYPAGFSTEPTIVIQPWTQVTPPAYPIPTALGFSSSKNFTVDFSGEGLLESDIATLPDTARIASGNWVRAVAGGAGAPAENNSKQWNALWKTVKLDPKTGVFAGKQVLRRTVGGKTANIEADVGGVLSFEPTLGENPFAFGQYVVKTSASTTTGLVTFSGPLEDNTALATVGSYSLVIDRILLSDSGNANTPANIPGTPADGATISFTVSEDLGTMVFGGRRLKLNGGVQPGAIVFTDASSANTMNTLTVTLYRSTFSGEIIGVAGMYTRTTISGFVPRIQTLTFQHQSPLADNLTRR